MKRSVLRFLALALAVCLCLGAVAARAADLWSEQFYRAVDSSNDLSDAEQVDLDDYCIEIMKKYEADVALTAVTEEDLQGFEGPEEYAAVYYDNCGFGYGAEHTGFLALYDLDTEKVLVEAYGGADDLIPRDYLDFIQESAPGYREQYGVYGVLYSCARFIDSYLGDSQEGSSSEGPPAVEADPSGRGADPGKPFWYPNDPKSFKPYHDDTAPRVVDLADIFSDEDEVRMEQRLWELRSELDKDVVVFTDVSSYGLSHAIYAADYYDFNGYGVGPEFEGLCLMVCMDPDDRGWWCCATGSETRGLYTEDNANALDDELYTYMAGGRYADGVSDWIENVRTMYLKGFPFSPDWMPDRGETVERTHNGDTPRVTDALGLLTEDQVAQLTARAKEISDAWGVDVAVHLDNYVKGLDSRDYSDQYYYHSGLGFGDEYEGILLTALQVYGTGYICNMTAEGAGAMHLTEVNRERLIEQCEDSCRDGEVYKGVRRWLDQVDGMYRKGRVPRTAGSWTFTAVIESIVGAFAGLIVWIKARLGMHTPETKTNADAYLVPGSLQVERLYDNYLGTTSVRRYDPVQRSSSGGGGSSYSGGYSGSSGSSHSGSGRSF